MNAGIFDCVPCAAFLRVPPSPRPRVRPHRCAPACNRPARKAASAAGGCSTAGSKHRGRVLASTRSAFTLVEVVVALLVFLLIVGAIFSAVSVTVRATTAVAEEQLYTTRVDALLRFCRQSFANLSPEARVRLQSRAEGVLGSVTELLISSAPDAFNLPGITRSDPNVALSALPDGTGAATLSLLHFPGTPDANERDLILRNGRWLKLLPKVNHVQWRFLDADANQFLEEWDENRGRPRLIELTLGVEGHAPVTTQFWLPPVRSLGVRSHGAPPRPSPPPSR
jgi:type II secretory pathway pseudopilin PulG